MKKPTKAQRAALERMREGALLKFLRFGAESWARLSPPGKIGGRLHLTVALNLRDSEWTEIHTRDWRGNTYKISAEGLRVLES